MRLSIFQMRRIVGILCIYFSVVSSEDLQSQLPHSYTYEAQTPQKIKTGCRGTFFPETKQTHQQFHVIDATGIPKYVEPGSTVQIAFPIINNGRIIQAYKKQLVHFSDICFPSQCNAPTCGNNIGPLTVFTGTTQTDASHIHGDGADKTIVGGKSNAGSTSMHPMLEVEHQNLNLNVESNHLESLPVPAVLHSEPENGPQATLALDKPIQNEAASTNAVSQSSSANNESEKNKAVESIITASSASDVIVVSTDDGKTGPYNPPMTINAIADASGNIAPSHSNCGCCQFQSQQPTYIQGLSMNMNQNGDYGVLSPQPQLPPMESYLPWFPFSPWGQKVYGRKVKPDKPKVKDNIVRDAQYYASLPGSILGSTHVIYYASCKKDAFYQPAIVSYCPTPIPNMMDSYQKVTETVVDNPSA